MIVKLTQMSPGQTGVVVEVTGGRGCAAKLENMGLRPGKKIKKVSSILGRGPQMVEIDSMRIAVGFGMAEKISVEVG